VPSLEANKKKWSARYLGLPLGDLMNKGQGEILTHAQASHDLLFDLIRSSRALPRRVLWMTTCTSTADFFGVHEDRWLYPSSSVKDTRIKWRMRLRNIGHALDQSMKQAAST
jgi:hypothetical protein